MTSSQNLPKFWASLTPSSQLRLKYEETQKIFDKPFLDLGEEMLDDPDVEGVSRFPGSRLIRSYSSAMDIPEEEPSPLSDLTDPWITTQENITSDIWLPMKKQPKF